ncbi:MAG: hypothetical protein WA051_01290 [Minisyncoccia bacterium]
MKSEKNFNLKNERGFIPLLLLIIILYLILKYSYNFDVWESVRTNGLPYTVGHFFGIMWTWWTDHLKPFMLEALGQISQTVKVPVQ